MSNKNTENFDEAVKETAKNLLLHTDLEPAEMAEVIVRECGMIKAKAIAWALQVCLEDEMRKILKDEPYDKPQEKWADVSPEGTV